MCNNKSYSPIPKEVDIMLFKKYHIICCLLLLFSCSSLPQKLEKVYIEKLKLEVDRFEVTIGQFREFIITNNYQTTADSFAWSGVFNLDTNSWDSIHHANWEKPLGKKEEDNNLPVTQVSYYDACAYCKWKNGRLPTAKEWDIIAGEEIIKGNVWEGPFPVFDSGQDGYFKSIAPIGQFSPNENNIHDLFGNVWEWTSTPSSTNDKAMMIKGGSFLCDISYCSGYIPSKYQTTLKDSGLNHLGFRCVY